MTNNLTSNPESEKLDQQDLQGFFEVWRHPPTFVLSYKMNQHSWNLTEEINMTDTTKQEEPTERQILNWAYDADMPIVYGATFHNLNTDRLRKFAKLAYEAGLNASTYLAKPIQAEEQG